MAKKLNSFPERPPKGKWNKFFDGNVWELKQGEDFKADETPQLIRNRMNAAAHASGLRLRTRIVDEQTLVIRAYNPRSSKRTYIVSMYVASCRVQHRVTVVPGIVGDRSRDRRDDAMTRLGRF